MQNAKDTFYEMLRDRIAAGNAGRTVVVRGTVRPGVIVDENEITGYAVVPECFRLRWTALRVSDVVAQDCHIQYSTAGGDGGMDRGRALAAMDGELENALSVQPMNSLKKNFKPLASGGTAVEMQSRVWWSDVTFAPLTEDSHGLHRVATVTVWSYREAGEV